MKKQALIFILPVVITACTSKQNDEVVYIDSVKVFENFEMKKDYDLKMEKDLSRESKLVDSIGVLLNSATEKKEENLVMKYKKDLYIAEKVFNDRFQELSYKYTSEVNKRLNEYLKDFGKQEGLGVILGSTGEGNIMFVDERLDVTNKVIEFINKHY